MQNNLRMRHVVPATLVLVLGVFAATLVACGGGYGGGSSGVTTSMGCGGQYGAGCPAPTIALQSPAATVDRTVTLSATAAAPTGATVMQVNFLIDGASVGTASTAPYTVSWDSTTASDGKHTVSAVVTDSQGQMSTSPPITITVDNNPAFTVAMVPAQIFPAPASSAKGTANLTVKLANGTVTGKVTLSGVTASAVSINGAFAGNTGASLIMLTANAGTAGEWDVPSGAALTAEQMTALLQGGLYVIATSAANPTGEIRGQITPADVQVVFAALAGTQETPPVTIAAGGVAAVTVDSTADTITVHVHTTGVDEATAAEVDTAAAGSAGPKLVALTKDSVDPGHWSVELAAITATDLTHFSANEWYVNVLTATDPSGAIRGQIDASTTSSPPPPPPPTLTQLTTTVFAVCGACHTGGGSALPASMDLRPGHIYASIVNVPSVEQPSLDRVKPGDPTNSYVVQKLEGAPTISGARMPFGGPYLSQATINQLVAWIAAGAPNN